MWYYSREYRNGENGYQCLRNTSRGMVLFNQSWSPVISYRPITLIVWKPLLSNYIEFLCPKEITNLFYTK